MNYMRTKSKSSELRTQKLVELVLNYALSDW